MSLENARRDLESRGFAQLIVHHETGIATVQDAAATIGCEENRIAKTLSFLQNDVPVLIVMAGHVKIDNRKYKDRFGVKAKMIQADQVEALIGHQPGGVCPFGIPEGVQVWLDDSLKAFPTTHVACGSLQDELELTPEQLEAASLALGWVAVTKEPTPQ